MASLSEYGDVVRITSSQNYEVLKRDGYAYIAEHKPLAARQYCRDMTIARGRILYEVWVRLNIDARLHGLSQLLTCAIAGSLA